MLCEAFEKYVSDVKLYTYTQSMLSFWEISTPNVVYYVYIGCFWPRINNGLLQRISNV